MPPAALEHDAIDFDFAAADHLLPDRVDKTEPAFAYRENSRIAGGAGSQCPKFGPANCGRGVYSCCANDVGERRTKAEKFGERGRLVENGTLQIENMKIGDRKSTRLNSSHMSISYAVFCLKKKTNGRANRADA